MKARPKENSKPSDEKDSPVLVSLAIHNSLKALDQAKEAVVRIPDQADPAEAHRQVAEENRAASESSVQGLDQVVDGLVQSIRNRVQESPSQAVKAVGDFSVARVVNLLST